MSGSLRLNGGTSGYSEITAPAVAGDQTFTLPAVGGELVTAPPGGSVVGYQQGVWTPTTNLGQAEVITSNAWWRIGNMVTVQAQLSSFNNSAGSIIEVTGIPYTNSAAALGAAMSNKFNNPVTASYLSTTAALSFYKSAADKNNLWSQLAYIDRLDSNSSVWFSLSYQTNDTTWTPINGATIS